MTLFDEICPVCNNSITGTRTYINGGDVRDAPIHPECVPKYKKRIREHEIVNRQGKHLRILFVDEIPQWVMSSEKAAYHPYSNTIFIHKDYKIEIFHELGHWIACKFNLTWLHAWLDNKEGGHYI